MTALLLVAALCIGADGHEFQLHDITATCGIDFTPTCGTLPSREILEVNGGGMALLDFDSDGDLDLFIANGATLEDPTHGPSSRLFENRSADGRIVFHDSTAASGIAITRWAMGAAAGDYDGDGHVDLYISCHGPNVLLRNLGDGTFQDVTDAAGVAGDDWSTSAAFGDLDADGDLDLFVVNYLEFDPQHPPTRSQYKGHEVMGGPHGLAAMHDVLHENLGDGTFRDVTVSSGVATASAAYGLNLAILDMNDDGLLDVFVGNDSMPNHLFLQEADADGLQLREHGQRRGISSNMDGHDQATMGVAVADVNGDARPDIFTTNFSSDTNTLHIAAPDGLWDDRTTAMGLGLASRRMLGWASAFADLDHDGDEDLLIVNGHVYPQATLATMDSEYTQPPILMARDGQRFTRCASVPASLTTPHRDRNLLLGDLDRDGDLDVLIGELNGPVRVLQNTVASNRQGMTITLHDQRPESKDRFGLGAKLHITAGRESHTRWIPGGACFQSTMPPEIHLAIAQDIRQIDITVQWPDGRTQRFQNIPPAPQIVLTRID